MLKHVRNDFVAFATIAHVVAVLVLTFPEALIGGQEQTGTVTGRIEILSAPPPARMERGARYRSAMAMKSMEGKTSDQDERQNVVVYLEGPGLDAVQESSDARATLDQLDVAFVPHVLAVQKGTKVDVINHDKVYHNVFSLSGPKKFNIGRRPTGEAVPVRFDKSGVVQVFCDIHSQMTAFIVILENRFFAQPGGDGMFTIGKVPPGTYTLKVWHERLTTPDQKVTITPSGTITTNVVLH